MNGMVTQAQLREHLGRRPFRPFRVTLVDGEAVDVTRTAQGVATPREFIVGTADGERFRWIRFDKIDRIDLFELRPSAS
jgi:hypothetical protein